MNKYFEKYRCIIVEIEYNNYDVDYVIDYFFDVIKVKNIILSNRYKQLVYNNRTKSYIRYNIDGHHITYGKLRNLYPSMYNTYIDYEKVFTIQDVKSGLIENIIKYGVDIPSYKPKKIIRTL